MALGRPDHRRHHPHTGPRARLTSSRHPIDQERNTRGPVEPRPPGATAGQPRRPHTRKALNHSLLAINTRSRNIEASVSWSGRPYYLPLCPRRHIPVIVRWPLRPEAKSCGPSPWGNGSGVLLVLSTYVRGRVSVFTTIVTQLVTHPLDDLLSGKLTRLCHPPHSARTELYTHTSGHSGNIQYIQIIGESATRERARGRATADASPCAHL
jgi:hypothetical protein